MAVAGGSMYIDAVCWFSLLHFLVQLGRAVVFRAFLNPIVLD